MDKENATQQTWNKKRIFIAFFLIMLLGIGAYFFKTKILSSESRESVKGISVEENKSEATTEAKIDIQKALREKIEELKQEASKLDITEIASSSPQIQKLIKDLSSLREYPTNQAKEICEKFCGNL